MEQFVDDKNNWKRFSQSSTTRWTTMANQFVVSCQHILKKKQKLLHAKMKCVQVWTGNRQSNILSQ